MNDMLSELNDEDPKWTVKSRGNVNYFLALFPRHDDMQNLLGDVNITGHPSVK